jgi:serine-type D-Ala-D-Ala carboxypeptidase/endopeptidase (penicillin-binding protein 4)
LGPKQIAMVVLVVVAAIAVVISAVAVATVALLRENGTPSARSTQVASSPSAAAPTPQQFDLPGPVLAAVSPGVVPNTVAVTNKIRAIKVKGATGSYSGSVVEVGTGKVLYAHDPTRPHVPASTMKLLTATAVLSILGPEHTFKTTVVSPQPGQIVLIGGGDPYLARKATADYPRRATISGLARATASRLKQDKIKKVSLGYDAGLFTGPAWNPRWPSFYRGSVSPTSALVVDEGRVGAASPKPRYQDPAKEAATAFAAALSTQGIKVTTTRPTRAPRPAPAIAEVSSMPLERIVEHVLMISDNDAAEVLFRQAAIGAGKAGSTAEGSKVVQSELTKLGIWEPGITINDGSGLSRQIKVPANSMVKALQLAAGAQHPELRSVITGLPVAGVEGSLRVRYGDDQSLAGRGVVRGKTGTLNKVRAQVGLIRTSDGSLLAYAFLINNPQNEYNARVWLDRVTTAISACGCR